MAVFNIVIYHMLEQNTVHIANYAEPIAAVYRNCEYIYRVPKPKPDLASSLPSRTAVCNSTYPTSLIDHAGGLSTEATVVQHCVSNTGRRYIDCDTLPFALIHKGSVLWI